MSVAANRYAKALIDALYPDRAEAGYDQLEKLNQLLRDNADARRLFENPTVPAEKRKAMLGEIGTALNLMPQIRNFVEILIDRNRLDILEEILVAYQKAMDERLGIVRATVTSAKPLDDKERENLSAKLGKMIGKQVRMEVSVDPALLGGVIAKVGSTIYDGSLRQQLQAFRARLVRE